MRTVPVLGKMGDCLIQREGGAGDKLEVHLGC